MEPKVNYFNSNSGREELRFSFSGTKVRLLVTPQTMTSLFMHVLITQIPARYDGGFQCLFCSRAIIEQIFQVVDSISRQAFKKRKQETIKNN